MKTILFLAQTGWSATDSANLQDMHDWMAALFASDGLVYGIGSAFVFGAPFMVYRLIIKSSREAAE